jgi:hypothetical protein
MKTGLDKDDMGWWGWVMYQSSHWALRFGLDHGQGIELRGTGEKDQIYCAWILGSYRPLREPLLRIYDSRLQSCSPEMMVVPLPHEKQAGAMGEVAPLADQAACPNSA